MEKDVFTVDDVIDAWFHGKRVARVTFGENGEENRTFLKKGAEVQNLDPQGNVCYTIDNPKFAIAATFTVNRSIAYVSYYGDGNCDLVNDIWKANLFSEETMANAVKEGLKMRDLLTVVEV